MMKRSVVLPVAVIVMAMLVGACTAESDGSATMAGVDRALLDTGDYPTVPAADYGRSTSENVLTVEANRMVDHVVAPFEVDPELTVATLPNRIILRSDHLRSVVAFDGQREAPANQGGILGYVSKAETPTATAQDPKRSLQQMVLRYSDPAQASAAVRQMHDAAIQHPNPAIRDTPEKIPGPDDTLASGRVDPADDRYTLDAMTAHGDYVIFTRVAADHSMKAWATESVATALRLQKPLIDEFVPTRTVEQGGTADARPLIDPNKILIYAIPTDEARTIAVYGPRGMAHQYGGGGIYNTLTEIGAIHTAVYGTTVYRAKSPEAAQILVDTHVTTSHSTGAVRTPSPPGLPNAFCITRDTEAGSIDSCVVSLGRYVAEAFQIEDRTAVHQQISAQYLILEHADQTVSD